MSSMGSMCIFENYMNNINNAKPIMVKYCNAPVILLYLVRSVGNSPSIRVNEVLGRNGV